MLPFLALSTLLAGTEFRLPSGPCNLSFAVVVISIVIHFFKKVLNDCNLGFKAVVIEGQNQTKYLNPVGHLEILGGGQ